MTSKTVTDIMSVLGDFGGNPQNAEELADFLGFDPIANPEDLLSGPLYAGLKQFLRGNDGRGFGVNELYRVGGRTAEPASVGLWVGVISDWGRRPSDRDRPRRRISRALVEHVQDRRSLALLVPPAEDRRMEAELIFPRTHVSSKRSMVTSVRAQINLDKPNRFHRDLLRGLRIVNSASLIDVSRLWQQQFSVESVTTKFYQEYAAVRDRMADALLESNDHHPVVNILDQRDARSWATRQMGRVLFLWFLQAKGWLGDIDGLGPENYLLDKWNLRADTPEREYFRGVLVPLFFDAMATGSSSQGENPVLGFVPYMNGGLFRRNALEDRIDDVADVSLPDDVFDPDDDRSLLGLLSNYRFTTQESTPDNQSVDPDPELLGRVFENLYQGDERRDTGTFYTPREIVHFMCRQAIDGYLRDTVGVDQETLNALRLKGTESEVEYVSIEETLIDPFVDALETIRICDPAVGSGAFLLGAIQEIVTLRRGILFVQNADISTNDLYQFVSDCKRRIIENSLFGVDINPEAVEICQLRLWLTMVLDLDLPPRPDSGWALPNLDFQIVAGDSLVDRFAGVSFKESWPMPQNLQLELDLRNRVTRLENNIARRKREFEVTHRDPLRLRELRDLIARDQSEIVRLHLVDAKDKAEKELESTNRNVRPSKTAVRRLNRIIDRIGSMIDDVDARDFKLVQKPFLWPIAFPEVLREGDPNAGFDVVLANPPYVRQEKLDSEDQLSYGDAFPEVHTGTADAYVHFYARAVQLLRPRGWLSFISSNKFMRADYGYGIRAHLPASLNIEQILDFGDLPLFEANGKKVAAYPVVLIGSRDNAGQCRRSSVADLTLPIRQQLSESNMSLNAENVRGAIEDLEDFLGKWQVSDFPQVMLKKDGWILDEPRLLRLFYQLMDRGTPLGEFVKGRMYRGVVTGLNDAFVLDAYQREELIDEDPKCAEIIKPWVRGQDIEKWSANHAGKFLIFAQRGIDIDQYPPIQRHLSWWKSDLTPKTSTGQTGRGRKRGTYKWFEIQDSTAYCHEFEHQKIVWGNMAIESKFARDSSSAFLAAPANFLVEPEPWLLPLLNSSLFNFIYPKLTVSRGGSYQEFKIGYIKVAPIITPSNLVRTELEDLTERRICADSSDQLTTIEHSIDEIVFDVYSVSKEDRRLIVDWLKLRRNALGITI